MLVFFCFFLKYILWVKIFLKKALAVIQNDVWDFCNSVNSGEEKADVEQKDYEICTL